MTNPAQLELGQRYARPLDLIKREWIDDVIERFRTAPILDNGQEFTVEDIHNSFPEPEHWNWYGCAMARLKNLGIIERVGYRPSNRPESNGRVIAVWRPKLC